MTTTDIDQSKWKNMNRESSIFLSNLINLICLDFNQYLIKQRSISYSRIENYLGDFDGGIPIHSPDLYKYSYEYDVEVKGWDDYKIRKQEVNQMYSEMVILI